MILGLKAAGITGGAASGILILSRFMYFVPATVVGLIVLVTRYGGLAAVRRSGRHFAQLPRIDVVDEAAHGVLVAG